MKIISTGELGEEKTESAGAKSGENGGSFEPPASGVKAPRPMITIGVRTRKFQENFCYPNLDWLVGTMQIHR